MDRYGSSVGGFGTYSYPFLFGIYTDMVLLSGEPSEIASEIGISRPQGGVLVIVFN